MDIDKAWSSKQMETLIKLAPNHNHNRVGNYRPELYAYVEAPAALVECTENTITALLSHLPRASPKREL